MGGGPLCLVRDLTDLTDLTDLVDLVDLESFCTW